MNLGECLGKWMVRTGKRLLHKPVEECRHEWEITHGCMSHFHYACKKCGAMDRVEPRFGLTRYRPGSETPLYWSPSSPWSEYKARRAESNASTSSS
jgi:hypothetical protein